MPLTRAVVTTRPINECKCKSKVCVRLRELKKAYSKQRVAKRSAPFATGKTIGFVSPKIARDSPAREIDMRQDIFSVRRDRTLMCEKAKKRRKQRRGGKRAYTVACTVRVKRLRAATSHDIMDAFSTGAL